VTEAYRQWWCRQFQNYSIAGCFFEISLQKDLCSEEKNTDMQSLETLYKRFMRKRNLYFIVLFAIFSDAET
jgi:hypothetical protein